MRTLLDRPRFTLGLALAASAMLLAGCSSGGDEPPGSRRDAAPKASSSPTMPAPEPTEVVARALLRAGQVGRGVEVQDDDDSLKSPTNDVCGKNWATNTQRIARRQLFFWKDAKAVDLVVSHEVVMYRKGGAREVLAEVEAAVADCDGWAHDQGEMTDPHLTDPPASAPDGAVAWAGTDDRQGTDFAYLAVYQARGEVLSALYLWANGSRSAGELAGALMPKVAERLEGAQN